MKWSKMLKEIWLMLSGFGIMFAVLSWFQESGILSSEIGGYKGWAAVSTGLVLYFLIGRRLGD